MNDRVHGNRNVIEKKDRLDDASGEMNPKFAKRGLIPEFAVVGDCGGVVCELNSGDKKKEM